MPNALPYDILERRLGRTTLHMEEAMALIRLVVSHLPPHQTIDIRMPTGMAALKEDEPQRNPKGYAR